MYELTTFKYNIAKLYPVFWRKGRIRPSQKSLYFTHLGLLVTQINRPLADQLKTLSKEKNYFHLELGFIRHQIFRNLRCPLVRFHQLFIVGPHNLQRDNFLYTKKQANYFLLQNKFQEERDWKKKRL